MKIEYFGALELHIALPDRYHYRDCGPVEDIFIATKTFIEQVDHPVENPSVPEGYEPIGRTMKLPDYPEINHRTAWIYYLQNLDSEEELFARAHEEAHALCFFGYRRMVEYLIRDSVQIRLSPTIHLSLDGLHEEILCDGAGIYALQRENVDTVSFVERWIRKDICCGES